MHVPRIIALAVVVALASGCSATELSWWRVADSDEREAVMVHIITDAADEFGVDAATLIAIARCESGLRADAKSTRSSAAGLFQHIDTYWPSRAEAIGMPDASPFDPTANARAAAMMAVGGFGPWAQSRGCWAR